MGKIMAKKRSKYVVLPNKSCIRPYAYSGAMVVDEGVSLITSAGVKLITIEGFGVENKEHVAALLRECGDAGNDFIQPNWDFLNADDGEIEEGNQ